jgi:putrescine transport system ATP-binding protein
VRLEGVSRAFDGVPAVVDVSLDVHEGEFFTLVGASGSGKTTLLRVLAGFERADSGRVVIGGADMAGVPPYARPVNMMFQSYALFPHMTVEDNVAFGLRQEPLPRDAIRARVADMLELVRLTAFAKRKPDQLSGGQRQRVALARSLAKHPRLLLLDEPLAALDRKLREETQFELVNIQERVGITFIMVTHDQDEAMTMSSRIAVMDHGRILQVGPPAVIYEAPATRFVAEFIGAANVVEGHVLRREGAALVIRSEPCGAELVARHAEDVPSDAAVAVAIRPEKIAVVPAADGGNLPNRLTGTVSEIGYLGGVSIYHVRLATGLVVRVQITNQARLSAPPLTWGETVTIAWPPEAAVVLTR